MDPFPAPSDSFAIPKNVPNIPNSTAPVYCAHFGSSIDFYQFYFDEEGASTVDWVFLTGFIVALTLSALSVVSAGSLSRTDALLELALTQSPRDG